MTFYGWIRIWNRIRKIWLDPNLRKRSGSDRIRNTGWEGCLTSMSGGGPLDSRSHCAKAGRTRCWSAVRSFSSCRSGSWWRWCQQIAWSRTPARAWFLQRTRHLILKCVQLFNVVQKAKGGSCSGLRNPPQSRQPGKSGREVSVVFRR